MLKRIRITETWRFLRRNMKSIAYYGAVALALAAIAVAAEAYRSDDEYAQKMVLTDELAAEAVAEKLPAPIYPDGMRNTRTFNEIPCWNDAMQLWENHCANDYKLEGGKVVCLVDGVVADAGESSVRGGYIIAEGSDDRCYVYCSVVPAEEIVPGKEIRAGEIIAVADDSMTSEIAMGAHLHLEVYEDEKPVDFERLCLKKGESVD